MAVPAGHVSVCLSMTLLLLWLVSFVRLSTADNYVRPETIQVAPLHVAGYGGLVDSQTVTVSSVDFGLLPSWATIRLDGTVCSSSWDSDVGGVSVHCPALDVTHRRISAATDMILYQNGCDGGAAGVLEIVIYGEVTQTIRLSPHFSNSVTNASVSEDGVWVHSCKGTAMLQWVALSSVLLSEVDEAAITVSWTPSQMKAAGADLMNFGLVTSATALQMSLPTSATLSAVTDQSDAVACFWDLQRLAAFWNGTSLVSSCAPAPQLHILSSGFLNWTISEWIGPPKSGVVGLRAILDDRSVYSSMMIHVSTRDSGDAVPVVAHAVLFPVVTRIVWLGNDLCVSNTSLASLWCGEQNTSSPVAVNLPSLSDNRTGSPQQLFVRLLGSFPSQAFTTGLVVTFRGLMTLSEYPCRVVNASTRSVDCLLTLLPSPSSAATNNIRRFDAGAGLMEWCDEDSVWRVVAPSGGLGAVGLSGSLQRSARCASVGSVLRSQVVVTVTSLWSSITTASNNTVDIRTIQFRLHCYNDNPFGSVRVFRVADDGTVDVTPLCASPTSTSMLGRSNRSHWIPVSDMMQSEALNLEVVCETPQRQAPDCHIALESQAQPVAVTIATTNDDALQSAKAALPREPIAAVLEIRSTPSQSISGVTGTPTATTVSTPTFPATFLASIIPVASNASLRVPVDVASVAECESIDAAAITSSTVADVFFSLRFRSWSAGTWNNVTKQCTWSIVAILAEAPLTDTTACQALATTMATVSDSLATLVFCGPRRLFQDPISWSATAIPAYHLRRRSSVVTCNESNATRSAALVDRLVPSSVRFVDTLGYSYPRVVLDGGKNGTASALLAAHAVDLVAFPVDPVTWWNETITLDGASTVINATSSVVLRAYGTVMQMGTLPSAIALVEASVAPDRLPDSLIVLSGGTWTTTRRGDDTLSWSVNVSIPTEVESGVYRYVLLPSPDVSAEDIVCGLSAPVTWSMLVYPPLHQPAELSGKDFFVLVPSVTAASSDSVGVQGGATITFRGWKFPTDSVNGSLTPVLTLGDTSASATSAVTISGVATSETALVGLLSHSPVFMAWGLGDLTIVNGTRVLNTIQTQWQMKWVHRSSGLTIGSQRGSISILLSAALPKITSVSPLLLSSLEPSPTFTIMGSNLLLRLISFCRVDGNVPIPLHNRSLTGCEICSPFQSNASYVTCQLPPQSLAASLVDSPLAASHLRSGHYAVYASFFPAGGTVFADALIEFVLRVDSSYPSMIGPFGGALITVSGAGFRSTNVELLVVCPTVTISCANHVDIVGTTAATVAAAGLLASVACELPPSTAAVIDDTQMPANCTVVVRAFIGDAIVPHLLSCADTALCSVTITSQYLPILTSIAPRHGQAPIAITVYGLQFTGSSTWLLTDASNLELWIGGTLCVISLPLFYDRMVCTLPSGSYCESSRMPHFVGKLIPFGYLDLGFQPGTQFSCSMALTSITPTTGSCMGGQVVTLGGYGLPSQDTLQVRIAGITCDVVSATNTTITCITGSVSALVDLTGEARAWSDTFPDVIATCCSYSYAISSTPTVTSIAPTSGSEGVRATLVGTKFQTGVRVEISGILITDAVVLSSTSVNLLIPRLPPATAKLRVSISGIGYAFHAATLDNFTYAMTITRAAPAKVSYNSGLSLTLVGSALSVSNVTATAGTSILVPPVTEVRICGRVCPITSLDFTVLVCTIPPYMDQHMLVVNAPEGAAKHVLNRADIMIVYRRVVSAASTTNPVSWEGSDSGSSTVSWEAVTDAFVPDSGDPLATVTLTQQTEVFVLAAPKHARLSLTAIWLDLNTSATVLRNTSCRVQRAGSVLEVLNPLDATVSDWSRPELWSAVPAWTSFPLTTRGTNGFRPVANMFDTARYFMMTCERIQADVGGDATPPRLRVRLTGVMTGITSQGGVCPINVMVTSASGIAELCSDPKGACSTVLTYDTSSTAVVQSVTVAYAPFSTAVRLSVTGSGFGLNADLLSPVILGGLNCAPQLAQESSFVCVTQGKLTSTVFGSNVVGISSKGLALWTADETLVGAEPWSSTASWYASVIPWEGSIVYIPAGASVLLDHSPPYLAAIIVEGMLVIQDVSIQLSVSVIAVLPGGLIQGGSVANPLTSSIALVFSSPPSEAMAATLRALSLMPKTILVRNGTINLHGAVESSSLASLLATTASAGSWNITVQDRVSWAVGSSIVVTASTPNLSEAEERIIAAKTLIGTQAILSLDQPLAFTHTRLMETWSQGSTETSSRALLLSRNVVIRGAAPESDESRSGVVILATAQSRLSLSNVLLFRCGSAAVSDSTMNLWREWGYFDSGTGAAAVLVNNMRFASAHVLLTSVVVRQSFAGGIALAHVTNVSLTNSIVYNTSGHGIATMGGDCWYVSIASCVVASTYTSWGPSLHSTMSYEGRLRLGADMGPPVAALYVTSSSLSVSSCVFTGSAGDAVWLALWSDAGEPSARCPAQAAWLGFSKNELSLARRHGFYVGGGSARSLSPRVLPCVDRDVGGSTNAFTSVSLYFSVIYSCMGHGVVVGAVGSIVMSALYVADCGASNIRVGATAGLLSVTSSLMSYRLTDGSSHILPFAASFPVRLGMRVGIDIVGSGLSITLTSVVFRNMTQISKNETTQTKCALRVCAFPSDDTVTPTLVTVSKLTFPSVASGSSSTSSTNLSIATLCSPVILLDSDGSLTQLQRETYVLSGAFEDLPPQYFTMCRLISNASEQLGAVVADGFSEAVAPTLGSLWGASPVLTDMEVDPQVVPPSRRSLMVCDTASTYAFYSVSVAVPMVESTKHCSAMRLQITHNGVLWLEMQKWLRTDWSDPLSLVDPASPSRKVVSVITVDGRPSTVTSTASVYSSRLQYTWTPLCNQSSTLVVCDNPVGYRVTRMSSSRPTYPFSHIFALPRESTTTFLTARRVTLQNVERPSLQMPLGVATWLRQWLVAAAPLLPVATSSTDALQAFLIADNGTGNASMGIIFSTTVVTEGVSVTLGQCTQTASLRCAPPFLPQASSSTDATVQNWTSAASWAGGRLPDESDPAVVVRFGTIVRLDANVTLLQPLVVSGTLVIDTDWLGRSLTLECASLMVFGTLLITSTRSDRVVSVRLLSPVDIRTIIAERSLGTRNISSERVLCANDPLSSIEIAPSLTIGCGTLWITGNVTARGAAVPSWWSLNHGVSATTRTHSFGTTAGFASQEGSSLKSGWRVGIASTDPRNVTGEENTIAFPGSNTSAEVNVTMPWQQSHMVTRITTLLGTRYPEAVNLFRSIVVECGRGRGSLPLWDGGSTNGTVGHCAIVVSNCPLFPSAMQLFAAEPSISLRFVSLRRFGRWLRDSSQRSATFPNLISSKLLVVGGEPALHVRSASAAASLLSLTGVVWDQSLHTALYVNLAFQGSLSLNNCVVWGSVGSGVVVAGGNVTLSAVLIAGTVYPPSDIMNAQPRLLAAMCGVADVGNGSTTMSASTVAGSESEGFCLPYGSSQFTAVTATTILTAKACSVGVFLFLEYASATNAAVTAPTVFEVFRNSLVGLLSTQHQGLTVSGVVAAMNPVGMFIGSSGASTKVSASTVVGFAGQADISDSCLGASVLCSPSFALLGSWSCGASLFLSAFDSVGILLPPTSLTNIPLDYDRTQSSSLLLYITDASSNTLSGSSVSLTGVTFEHFGDCGYGIAFHPIATGAYPLLSSSSLTAANDVPNGVLYAPASSLPATTSIPCFSTASGACAPTQSLLIYDQDGSLHSSNTTAILVGVQSALTLLSCDSTALSPTTSSPISVCATTIPFGKIRLQDADDNAAMPMGCVTATILASSAVSVKPEFATCVTSTRGGSGQRWDRSVALLVISSSTVRMSTHYLPRHLRISTFHCSSATVLRVQLKETNMRVTVWDGSNTERPMGTASPTTSSRSGEWYRAPYIVGDDIKGDAYDFVDVAIACGDSVALHHLVYGLFSFSANCSANDLDAGFRVRVLSALANTTGWASQSILVQSVRPDANDALGHMIVRFEAVDNANYNATAAAASIDACLTLLNQVSVGELSNLFGVLVLSASATLTTTTLASASTVSPSSFALGPVLALVVGVGCVAGIIFLVYSYIVSMRLKAAKAKLAYTGPVFGSSVEVLPDTLAAALEGFACLTVEETFPDMSATARLQHYTAVWRVEPRRKLPGHHDDFGASVRSTDSVSAPSPAVALTANIRPLTTMLSAGSFHNVTALGGDSAPTPADAAFGAMALSPRPSIHLATSVTSAGDSTTPAPQRRLSIVNAFLAANAPRGNSRDSDGGTPPAQPISRSPRVVSLAMSVSPPSAMLPERQQGSFHLTPMQQSFELDPIPRVDSQLTRRDANLDELVVATAPPALTMNTSASGSSYRKQSSLLRRPSSTTIMPTKSTASGSSDDERRLSGGATLVDGTAQLYAFPTVTLEPVTPRAGTRRESLLLMGATSASDEFELSNEHRQGSFDVFGSMAGSASASADWMQKTPPEPLPTQDGAPPLMTSHRRSSRFLKRDEVSPVGNEQQRRGPETQSPSNALAVSPRVGAADATLPRSSPRRTVRSRFTFVPASAPGSQSTQPSEKVTTSPHAVDITSPAPDSLLLPSFE